MYYCDVCGKELSTKWSLQRHVKSYHRSDASSNEDAQEDDENVSESDNFWCNLKDEVEADFTDQLSELLQNGHTVEQAERSLAPQMQKAYAEKLRDRMQELSQLSEDQLYNLLLEESKRIMDEDGVDKARALDAAVRKKQYLIDQVFDSIVEVSDEDE